MHYIPDPKLHESYHEEEDEEVILNSIMETIEDPWGSSSNNNNNKARKSQAIHRPKPTQEDTKKKKKSHRLKKIVTRAFAKHKPAPGEDPDIVVDPDEEASEHDALLVIHCDHYSVETPSLTIDSHNTTPSWAQLKQQPQQQQQHSMATAPLAIPHHPMQDVDGDASTSSSNATNDNVDEEIRRERRIAKAQARIRQQTSFSVWQGCVAIGVYICLSICCFSFGLEHWSVLDSSYFAVVTFTTIGYGDLVPDTTDARIFTCFWALSGVACLGIALGVLGSQLLEVHDQKRVTAQRQQTSQVIGLFDAYSQHHHHRRRQHHNNKQSSTSTSQTDNIRPNNVSVSSPSGFSTIEEGKRRFMYDNLEDDDLSSKYGGHNKRRRNNTDSRKQGCCRSCCTTCSAKCIRITGLLIFFSGILYLISQAERWDITTTIYYGIITASTVGYGDLAPKTEAGRSLAIVFIPFAVGIMGSFLETVAGIIIDARRKRYETYLHNKPLTLHDIRVLDSDGDGNVTRAEFLQFMLVAMNQVDKGVLERLNKHFDQLDYDKSGIINKDDLTAMAQQRMQQQASTTRYPAEVTTTRTGYHSPPQQNYPKQQQPSASQQYYQKQQQQQQQQKQSSPSKQYYQQLQQPSIPEPNPLQRMSTRKTNNRQQQRHSDNRYASEF